MFGQNYVCEMWRQVFGVSVFSTVNVQAMISAGADTCAIAAAHKSHAMRFPRECKEEAEAVVTQEELDSVEQDILWRAARRGEAAELAAKEAPAQPMQKRRKKPAAVPAAAKPAGGRPPCKVDFTSVERSMHLPQPEAAKALGISLTTLKIVCRTQGLTKWPYRRAGRNGGASRADA